MTLNATGLGIGISPSTNLHVDGNALVSEQLFIGGSSGSSNLNVQGTWGTSYQIISSNTTLSDTSYILADTSSQSVFITLPYAGNCDGRQYHIKRITNQNDLIIQAASGNFENGFEEVSFLESNDDLPYTSFLSASNIWYLTYRSSQVVMGNILQGLVGWWKFDETSSNTASDSSGYGHDATTNSLDFSGNGITGVIGRGLSFDGTDDYLHANTLAATMANENTFSVSLWAKHSAYVSSTFAISFDNSTNSSAKVFGIYPYDNISGNGVRVFHNGTSIINQNDGAIADSQFHFFVYVSRSATEHEVYVDGVLTGTSATSKSLPSDLSQINIGRWGGNDAQYFSGSLDDIRVYNRPLSTSEIQALYQLGQ